MNDRGRSDAPDVVRTHKNSVVCKVTDVVCKVTDAVRAKVKRSYDKHVVSRL